MFRAALVLLIGLVGCERSYAPLETECLPGTYSFDLRIVEGPELRQTYRELTGQPPGDLEGFTAYQGGRSTMYVLPLRGKTDSQRLQTWGHEIAHVVCGLWHGQSEQW